MRLAAFSMTLFGLALTASLLWTNSPASAADGSSFELVDGDRVALIGGTFIEREGQFGQIETSIAAAYPDRKLVFRNLGWSGDTVWAESRGVFDAPAVGYQRLIDLVKEVQPTVIVFGYGQNESFAGPSGLDAFIKQYEKLCDDVAPTKARLVFLTPLPLASAEPLFPDLTTANQRVAVYSDAIRQLAARRHGTVIDLGGEVSKWLQGKSAMELSPYFEGMHFSDAGYAAVAEAFCRAAGLPTPPNPSVAATKALRQRIVAKNTLFFHRWRPQNVTYLFLFRKHEQGNNAVEIPQFDPLIEAAEKEIEGMKRAGNNR